MALSAIIKRDEFDILNVLDINSSNIARLNNLKMSSTSHEWTIKGIDSAIGDSQTGTSPDTTDSDSGQLAIYNGATKLWGITEGGWIQSPNRPSFLVGALSTIANESFPTYAAGTVISFGNIGFNNGGHYDNTNYRFTAPVSGTYMFFYSIYTTHGAAAKSVCFRVNGNQLPSFLVGGDVMIAYQGPVDISDFSLTSSSIIPLSPGDYVDVAIRTTSNLRFYTGHTWWYGYLIG